LFTRYGFRELFEKRAVANRSAGRLPCRGRDEILKIASMADTYNIALAPHNRGPDRDDGQPPSRLCDPELSDPGSHAQRRTWRNDVVDAPILFEGGYARPPARPGIVSI